MDQSDRTDRRIETAKEVSIRSCLKDRSWLWMSTDTFEKITRIETRMESVIITSTCFISVHRPGRKVKDAVLYDPYRRMPIVELSGHISKRMSSFATTTDITDLISGPDFRWPKIPGQSENKSLWRYKRRTRCMSTYSFLLLFFYIESDKNEYDCVLRGWDWWG